MSKLQFIALLSPAVGSFVLVILAWMQSNSRLSDLKEHMNQRFAESDRKFGELRFDVERKFVELRVDMNRQFDHMGVRMDRIENDQKQFFNVTGKLDGRIDEIARR